MIYVVGLGPGNPDYVLPIARQRLRSCDTVIGAKRNLAAVATECKATMDLSVGFEALGAYLKAHETVTIGVVVSGDTGFYSMLAFVKRHVSPECIQVIPGISSLQYMYSKLSKGYEETRWVSLHGRKTDLAPLIKDRVPMGILTDKEQNNQTIAKAFFDAGVEEAIFYVGERLSYEDERITRLTVAEAMVYEADALSVVVVDYPGMTAL